MGVLRKSEHIRHFHTECLTVQPDALYDHRDGGLCHRSRARCQAGPDHVHRPVGRVSGNNRNGPGHGTADALRCSTNRSEVRTVQPPKH